MSERKTEQIVREHIEGGKAVSGMGKVRYWEQSPDDKRVKKLLAKASKSGGSGAGYPEFVVAFDDYPDFLIVVECKASPSKHQSGGRDKPADYAVDGALHYASHLTADFNVLAIGVSGTNRSNLRVGHFFCFRGDHVAEPAFGSTLLPLKDYLAGYLQHNVVFSQDLDKLLQFTRELNGRLHTLKVKETNRSLLISAILMALRDPGFVAAYRKQPGERLLRVIKDTMLKEMRGAGIPKQTLGGVETSYGFMNAPGKLRGAGVLSELVGEIDGRINSFQKTHQYHDVLGRLYVEFLRYSNSDAGLGIVLTPPHITELAADLVQAGKDDVIYDNCAGTGGFLISGMKRMVGQARGNLQAEAKIKSRGIVGTELQADISALLCSNMFIHGDGRSNMFQGDCFDATIAKRIKNKFQPTVGMLNPPFKGEADDIEEMAFVINNLNSLKSGGRCAALLPMQCALANKGERLALKENILRDHTLEGVLSLPNDLFHNSKVSVVTCLMIFTAGRPHPANKESWFGYCKDDGFVKQKPMGRVDHHNRWQNIKDKWLDGFVNRKNVPGFGIMRKIGAGDEWCAEAYIEVDYSGITEVDFRETLRDFSIYNAKVGIMANSKPIPPPVKNWRAFRLDGLFDIAGTQTTPLSVLRKIGPGEHPYVTTQAENNGVAGHFNHFTEAGGVITVDSAVLGYACWQPKKFSASDHVEKLIPKFPINGYIALFIVTLLNSNQFRYNYGRKASQSRLKTQQIRLPVKTNGTPDFDLMERYVKSLPFSRMVTGELPNRDSTDANQGGH